MAGKVPKVSVIIPAYGSTEFLPQAIDSVFNQTFADFELIVVDDNDPNTEYRAQTSRIISANKRAGRRIIYIQHERNKNGSAARNTGVFHSKGKFISFLDSDDFYHVKRLEAAVSIMDSADVSIGGVYTGVEFRRRGKTFCTHTDVSPGKYLVETLACKFMIGTGSNLFLKREVIEELGGFDEAFDRHQDYEFLVRFFQRYELAAIPEPLVIKNNENFNLPPFERMHDIKRQYLNKYKMVIESLTDDERGYVISKNYSWLGEMALRERKRAESSEMYRIAKRGGFLDKRDTVRRALFWAASWIR